MTAARLRFQRSRANDERLPALARLTKSNRPCWSGTGESNGQCAGPQYSRYPAAFYHDDASALTHRGRRQLGKADVCPTRKPANFHLADCMTGRAANCVRADRSSIDMALAPHALVSPPTNQCCRRQQTVAKRHFAIFLRCIVRAKTGFTRLDQLS